MAQGASEASITATQTRRVTERLLARATRPGFGRNQPESGGNGVRRAHAGSEAQGGKVRGWPTQWWKMRAEASRHAGALMRADAMVLVASTESRSVVRSTRLGRSTKRVTRAMVRRLWVQSGLSEARMLRRVQQTSLAIPRRGGCRGGSTDDVGSGRRRVAAAHGEDSATQWCRPRWRGGSWCDSGGQQREQGMAT
ncbi:hypothetical protein ZWY2020_008123 [Hordeum vulgare]|nr:hypothetical protein ZWY2020_008123 [Hordeum vulgare]